MKREDSSTSMDVDKTDRMDAMLTSASVDGEMAVPVSCSSSLDSFLMKLPGVDDCGIPTTDTNAMAPFSDAEEAAAATTESAAAGASESSIASLSTNLSTSFFQLGIFSNSFTTHCQRDGAPVPQTAGSSSSVQTDSPSTQISSTTMTGDGLLNTAPTLTLPPATTTTTLTTATTVESAAVVIGGGGSASSGGGSSSNTASHHVPEFLYQLTKMLTDDNRDTIEWSKGRIEVHNPRKLETKVLNRYFRHSKFASFQRQLNYFGFRKLAGKGKMAPCSYVNDAAGEDLRSLLYMRRKAGPVTSSKDKGGKKKEADGGCSAAAAGAAASLVGTNLPEKVAGAAESQPSGTSVNPILADILYRNRMGGAASLQPIQPALAARTTTQTPSSSSSCTPVTTLSAAARAVPDTLTSGDDPQRALARSAIGRGVRHGYGAIAGRCSSTSTQSSNIHPSAVLSTSSRSISAMPAEIDWSAAGGGNGDCAHDDDDFKDTIRATFDPQESLSQLESNFRNSLNDLGGADDFLRDAEPTPLNEMRANSLSGDDVDCQLGSFLPRDSSLIDLAMIPSVDDSLPPASDTDALSNFGLCFIDFTDSVLSNSLAATTANSITNPNTTASKPRDDTVDNEEGNFF